MSTEQKLRSTKGAVQKVQENKSRYEEDQQIRFNAIMMKLKREKENALFQAHEKIKELTQCVEQQEKDIKSLMMEKENVTGEYEQARGGFCLREQELLAGIVTGFDCTVDYSPTSLIRAPMGQT